MPPHASLGALESARALTSSRPENGPPGGPGGPKFGWRRTKVFPNPTPDEYARLASLAMIWSKE